MESRLRKIRGNMTLSQFADVLKRYGGKFDKGKLSKYESGYMQPTTNFYYALAKMGYNVNWVITGEGNMMNKVDYVSDVNQDVYGKMIRKVPIITSIICGEPIEKWVRDGEKYLSIVGINGLKDPFILIAKGDSMFPEIKEGDMLLCSAPISEFKSGNIGIVTLRSGIESKGIVRVITIEKNQIVVSSINPKYTPKIYRINDIYQLYYINQLFRKFNK